MIEREGAAYHEAGHAVVAYLRNVHFERVTILADERYQGGPIGRNYELPAPDDSEGTATPSLGVRIELGLAGAFAQCLHVGGFTPAREASETYIRALNACLKCSEDDAAQRALTREVRHENVSVGQNVMDEVLSSPDARDILFEVSDHWHLVEAVTTALMERGSLSQAEVHQIVQANER